MRLSAWALGLGLWTVLFAGGLGNLRAEESAGEAENAAELLPGAQVYPSEYFKRDRIRIGAWVMMDLAKSDESEFRRFSDCGVDMLILYQHFDDAAVREKIAAMSDRYGLEVYYNEGAKPDVSKFQDDCLKHPSFGGNFIIDEPGSDQFDTLAADCAENAQKTGGRPYLNLLPMYANAAQLKYGAGAAEIEYYDADPDLYKKYCDAYCEKFDLDYLCTDIYPLNWVEGKKVTYGDYLESINIAAASAREHRREFWCYIQTFGWMNGKRTPTEAEYRWQVYSMLSFGCKGILLWVYDGYLKDFPSLVSLEGETTEAWYEGRSVFREVRSLSDTFVQYRNLGAFHHAPAIAAIDGEAAKDPLEVYPYLRFSHQYAEFKTIQEIDCAEPLLVGCFEKKDGAGKAFTLVNMTELNDARGVSPRVKIDGKKVVAYYRGVPATIVPDADGFYTFHLGSGEGVFVTID